MLRRICAPLLKLCVRQESAELELQKERQKFGDAQTVGELRALVATLRKEAQASKGQAGRQKSLLEEIESVRSQAREGMAAAEVISCQKTPTSSCFFMFLWQPCNWWHVIWNMKQYLTRQRPEDHLLNGCLPSLS